MQPRAIFRRVVKRLLRQHGDVKSFEHELRAAGGESGRVDTGLQVVARQKIVGSVGRWRNLRSDFFYRSGAAITERFLRIGQAMRQGVGLPPLELYKMKVRRKGATDAVMVSEYYVVDGHHRVAMARQLGQDFLDAHVVEYKLAANSADPNALANETAPADQPPPADASASPNETVDDGESTEPNARPPSI